MRLARGLPAALALLLGACASLPDPSPVGGGIPTFRDPGQVDAFIRKQRAEERRQRALRGEDGDYIVVTGSRVEPVDITNVQEAGVDEGGIVKATGEFLVILRRGRLHVVRHGGDALEVMGHADAFPPGDPDPDDTWYDEMLLAGGMVIVIGYSYGEDASEISRFRLSGDGALAYLDTHYLSSFDYYSSRNYASRLVGGRLATYTPIPFGENWREALPQLERRLPDGNRERVATSLDVEDIGLAAAMLEPVAPGADQLHAFTLCDVLAAELACRTRAVLGTWSAEYYFSGESAWLWTAQGGRLGYRRDDEDERHVLYRVPLNENGPMEAIEVSDAPVDQISFLEDEESQSLFVLAKDAFTFDRDDPFAATMWEAEFARGALALHRVPFALLGNGGEALPQLLVRPLPEVKGWRLQNRYAGRHLLYGGGGYGDEAQSPQLFVTPLDSPWVQRIDLSHGISRIERLGSDAVVVGEDGDGALGFSVVEPGGKAQTAQLRGTTLLPAASEGETRSHAFFYRPDAGEARSGIMALPVDRELGEGGSAFLGSASAIAFLRREGAHLDPLGELVAQPDAETLAQAAALEALDEAGECEASCIDWYGNARPIFLGERIFALMGDELVEGERANGAIIERRRVTITR